MKHAHRPHHCLPSELERQIRQLGPDFFSEEPDLSEDLIALDINYNQVDHCQTCSTQIYTQQVDQVFVDSLSYFNALNMVGGRGGRMGNDNS